MTSILLLASLAAVAPADAGGAAAYAPSADTVQAADSVRSSVIQGQVLSDRSGMALPFVLVEVEAGDDYRAVLSDEEGRYRLRGIPPGTFTLRARSLDHAPLEVTVDVPAGARISLDLSLPIRPIGLPTIRVVARPTEGVFMDDAADVSAQSQATTRLRALEASPGAAEIGLASAARTVNRMDPADPSSVLFVRGGASDLKLVLLDGAPVASPFHLGGLLDPLPRDAIASSRVRTGGAPSRLDGGLSYILEMESRAGRSESHSATGSVDMVGAGGRVEGPVAGGTYLAAARSVHSFGADQVLESPLPLSYSDALTRGEWTLSDSDTLAVTGFWNREAVQLGRRGEGVGTEASWGNQAGSLRYRGRAGSTSLRLTVGGGGFEARIPIGIDPGDYAAGHSERLRVVAEARRGTSALDVSAGASYESNATRYRAVSARDGAPEVEREGVGRSMAAFTDVTWKASPEVQLRAGVRGNFFLNVDDTRLSPRFDLSWTPLSDLVLSASAGRYHQYVRSATSLLPGSLGPFEDGDSGSGVEPDLSVAGATHYALAARGRPTDELTVGGQTYVKNFDNPPGGVDFRTVGFDGWADWTHGEWAAWAGLVMTWTWAPETALTPAEIQSEERLKIYDRRLVSGGFRAPLPSGVRVSMEVTTSSGLPFTPFPATTSPAGSGGGSASPGSGAGAEVPNVSVPTLIRTPRSSYLRVDAEIYRSWSAHVMDTPVRIRPYVRVLNALDRSDALFYRYVRDEDLVERRSLGVVPLLPVVGLEWSVL